MVYEKDKIRRLIEYKDKIINEQFKNDLEWILSTYNKYFVDKRDYEQDSQNVRKFKKRYYDLEDENANLKEKLDLYKRKYKILKINYTDLRSDYMICCKKLKSMI